jgi:hypothetical protein
MTEDRQDCWGEYELSLEELEALPTLAQGQADDLKIESDTERVWLSRCTVEDGEPWNNKVTVERKFGGSWIEVEAWEAVTDGSSRESFSLSIELGNDGMRSPEHVAGTLRTLAEYLDGTGGWQHIDAGTLRDANGNTVGQWDAS